MTDELSNVTPHLNLPAINILQENNNNNSNSERSDFIILSRAKRARSLLTETETDFDQYSKYSEKDLFIAPRIWQLAKTTRG